MVVSFTEFNELLGESVAEQLAAEKEIEYIEFLLEINRLYEEEK